MAQKPASNLGGGIAVLMGILVVGGLAATPFYLAPFNSETRQLDAALDENITRLRRIVLNVDEHLGALTDLSMSLGDAAHADKEAVDRLVKANSEIIPPSMLSDLKRSAQHLQEIDRADDQRGTKSDSGERIPAGRPDIKSSVYKMQNVLLTANTNLLQQADKVLRDLRGAGTDTLRSDQHLGANRIRAILYTLQGRLERGRMTLEHRRAARYLRHAESLVDTVIQCRRDAEIAEAMRPGKSLDDLQREIAQTDAVIAARENDLAQLTKAISALQERIKTRETTARRALSRITELDGSGEAIHDEAGEYHTLTIQAREAEAEATALRDGILTGATRLDDDALDLLTAPYQGGQRVSGLRDLLHNQDLTRTALTHLQKIRVRLVERKAELSTLDREMQDQARSARRDADRQSAKITELLDEAKARTIAASKASKAAIQHLGLAEKAAKSALRTATTRIRAHFDEVQAYPPAATTRIREARSASSDATGSEAERLKMITNDGDMEASIHVLIAEASYQVALMAAETIDALRDGFETGSYISERTGRDSAGWPEQAVDQLRTMAVDKLAVAMKEYEDARRLISKTQASSSHGKILGRNYVWQVQVAQASVHMLHSALLDDADAAHMEKVAAYNLLTEAAEGREQSPLLSHAIDTILYLQQNP
ncbi:MAG: hypothetical protein ACE5EC_00270 [Phycisphaerae bacterium]